jgi:hypothetical protein
MVATRRQLTWNSMTPASPIDTGDVVDVLVDGEEPIRGTYCGLHPFPSGRVYAEILFDDDTWQFVCLEIPHTIRLVRESMSLMPRDSEDEPMPLSKRESRVIALCILGGCLFWGALFLWIYWR